MLILIGYLMQGFWWINVVEWGLEKKGIAFFIYLNKINVILGHFEGTGWLPWIFKGSQ
jgi:hypothetical protein